MKRSGLSALAGVSLLCLFILAACNTAPTLRYVIVAPTSSTISVGTTQQFTATAFYSDGSQKDVTATANWASSNSSVATVAAGVATGVGAGTATISASAGGQLATATLSVNALLSITISPLNQVIAAGATQQFTAMGTYRNPDGTTGAPTDITSLVTWASSKAAVATIDNTGLATAVANGVTVISAALNGVTSTTNLSVGAAAAVSLQVTPANPTAAIGNATTFTAMELYSDSTLHTPPAGTQIDWTSGTAATATLANASSTTSNTNVTAALAAGTTVITATEHVSGITGNTTLTVVTGSTHFAYVAINGSGEIQWYAVNAGSTTPLTNSQTLSVAQPQQVVLHPGGKYMYEIDVASAVQEFTIDTTTGKPTATGTPTSGGSGNPDNFGVIDPYGRFLYVLDSGFGAGTNGSIAGFTISPSDGSLTGISGMTPPSGTPSPFTINVNRPIGAVIDHSGKYLYVSNNNSTGTAGIAAFSIDQTTGALTALSTATFDTGSGPQLMAIDPTNKYLYVADDVDNTIAAFSIGANGILTAIGTTPFVVTGTPAPVSIEAVAVDPSGTHIYAVDGGNSGLTPPANTGFVYGFSIGTGGAIGSAISGTPIATGVFPDGGIAIDPTGALLAVENHFDNTMSLFKIGTGGGLTADTAVATDQAPLLGVFYNAP
jgi:6-phosphogluconolactonase (cycloisomerase 2 family)